MNEPTTWRVTIHEDQATHMWQVKIESRHSSYTLIQAKTLEALMSRVWMWIDQAKTLEALMSRVWM